MASSELDSTKTSLDRINARTRKLDKILCSQRVTTDKHELGYTNDVSTSNAKGNNGFVKSLVVTNPIADVAHKTAMKKKVSHSKRVPICHHCGVKGYIQPHCSKPRSSLNQNQWKKQKAVSPFKTKVVSLKKKTFLVCWYALCLNI